MESLLLPLRKIIAEYAAEYDFVDFDPPESKFMPLDVLHKKSDFMHALRENPGRIIHGGFHDIDHGEQAGDNRWIVEPIDDHKWSVLPEIPSWESIRQISEYSICLCTTAHGFALLEKDPEKIVWEKVWLSKDDPFCEIDLLILSDRNNDNTMDIDQIVKKFGLVKERRLFNKKYKAKFIPVVPDDVKRALLIPTECFYEISPLLCTNTRQSSLF